MNALEKFFKKAKSLSLTETLAAVKKTTRIALVATAVAASATTVLGAIAYGGLSVYGKMQLVEAQSNLPQKLKEMGIPEEFANDQPEAVSILDRDSLKDASIYLALEAQDPINADPATGIKSIQQYFSKDNAFFHVNGLGRVNFITPPHIKSERSLLERMTGSHIEDRHIDISRSAVSGAQMSQIMTLHELGHGLNHRNLDEDISMGALQVRLEGFADSYMVRKAREMHIPEEALQRFAMARTLSRFAPIEAENIPDHFHGFEGSYVSWNSDHATAGFIWTALKGETIPDQPEDRSNFARLEFQAQSHLASLIDEKLIEKGGFEDGRSKISQIADLMLELHDQDKLPQPKDALTDLTPILKETIENYVRSVAVLTPTYLSEMAQKIPAKWQGYYGQHKVVSRSDLVRNYQSSLKNGALRLSSKQKKEFTASVAA